MTTDTIANQDSKITNRLPVLKLIPLALAGFIAIMTETMPAGLLSQIGKSLSIKESLAGQLITLYALGSVLAAIPVIAATLHWPRKRLLLLATVGFFIFNALTAVSTHYILTLVARFLAGMAAGITWGLLIGYAKRIVQPHMEGRAIALVGVGQPIALAFGVPLAVWLGKVFGWDGAFWAMSVLSFLLLIWMILVLPDFKGIKLQNQLSVSRVFTLNGIKSLLLVLFLWILAHNILYTYIAPYLSNFGLTDNVDLILLIFGVSCLLGIGIIGIFIDKWLIPLTKGSLFVFALGIFSLLIANYIPSLLYLGVFLWGISFGGISTLLQKNLADRAAENADVAQSMFVTVFNLAVAIGGILGGILLDKFGSKSFPWAILILIFVIVLCLSNKKFSATKSQ
ncbi:MFS transporter [Myroides odoratus]|uniref:MFS transporter n=1 Tax=Myroides odoratus TaxID=256 RepID=UPI0039B11CEB